MDALKLQHEQELLELEYKVDLRVRSEVIEEINQRRAQGDDDQSMVSSSMQGLARRVLELEQEMKERVESVKERYEKQELEMQLLIGNLEDTVLQYESDIEKLQSMRRMMMRIMIMVVNENNEIDEKNYGDEMSRLREELCT